MGNELSNILPKVLARVQKATTTIFVNCNTTVFPKTGLFLCEQQHWAVPDSCPCKYQHKDVIWALFVGTEMPRYVRTQEACLCEWQHCVLGLVGFVWMATPRCTLIVVVLCDTKMCPEPALFFCMATPGCILILVCVNGNTKMWSWSMLVWMATPICVLILVCVNGNA